MELKEVIQQNDIRGTNETAPRRETDGVFFNLGGRNCVRG